MICKKHGEPRIQPVNGKCFLCCLEEVIAKITYLAHNWKGEALKSSDPPFIDAPAFSLNARDFPWLLDKTVNNEVVQVFRDLLSHAYLIAIQALLHAKRPIFVNSDINYSFKCLPVCFENAIDFRPQNDRILWQIHFLTADALGRTNEPKVIMQPRYQATEACHLEIGLRHLRLMRNPASFEIPEALKTYINTLKGLVEATQHGMPVPLEAAQKILQAHGLMEETLQKTLQMPDGAMAFYTCIRLEEILAHEYFDIKGDYLVGKGSFESGPLEKFVYMIVPESTRVLPEGRRKQFEVTIKALDEAMERNAFQEAEQMFKEAILFVPEESAQDRATKMLLLYQYGVFRLRKWRCEFLSDVPANPNENEDLLRRVRDYWREALSLFLSLSPQDIRSDSHPLRDIAKKIQDDFISAGLFTPTLKVD